MKIFNRKLGTLLAYLVVSTAVLTAANNNFIVTNLDSDMPGVAPITDPNLVNSWGLTFDAAGNLIVADNGTNLATSYARDGTILNFVVNVASNPSGVERNPSSSAFFLPSTSFPAEFLFATEDGTILAYNRNVDPNNAIVVVDRSSINSVYKGLAIAKSNGQYFIYATDFHNGLVNVFDASFNFVSSFTDPLIPAGFAPFNIASINNRLYVTYAKQLAPDNHDDQAGPGNGFIDIFGTDSRFIKRLVSNGALDSPWGLALAPKRFGKLGGLLLVGNFGNGVINIYDPLSGKFQGQLRNRDGVIVLPGLWAIRFDNSLNCHRRTVPTLFFASGPNCESDGLLGRIVPKVKRPNHHKGCKRHRPHCR